MNKGIYRLIFNKARGLMMVAGELATNRSSVSGASTLKSASPIASALMATLTPLRFALLLAMGQVLLSATANAEIRADRRAPASQQPTVLSSANGVPQVNIQAPTAGGVSRNQYSQFNVDSRGVILNNSRRNVSTQLGGMVSANPNLIGGTASVIVNEVNSSNPSRLNGFVEIAGTRANVVFANPAGITCSGCGFINAYRATLTTGTPVYNNGNLDSYRVEGGTIEINGTGLDASSTEYTHIIARSVKVNAGIWADELNIVAGTNTVKANTTADATERASTGSAPAFAIDVSALGGMYAGKIKLVGTENGVGVRNAGVIGAGVGGFTLSADGQVVNSQRIESQANIAIQVAGDVSNSGTVFSEKDININSQSTINHTGVISAYDNVTLSASGRIDTGSNSTTVAGINANGELKTSSPSASDEGSVTLRASGGANLQGTQVALTSLSVNTSNLTANNATQQAQTITLQASGQVTVNDSTLTTNQLTANATGASFTDSTITTDTSSVTATQSTIALDNTTLTATERVTLNAADSIHHRNNTQVASQSLNLRAQNISNNDSRLQQTGSGTLNIAVSGTINNDNGELETNSALNLNATTITNQSGTIVANGAIDLEADTLNNTSGTIGTNASLNVDADTLNNNAGRLQGSTGLSITADTLDNTQSGANGGLVSGDELSINTRTLNNDSGYIGAQNTLNVTSTGDASNTAGVIESGDNISLNTAALNNDQGRIQATTKLSIDTNNHTLTNTNSGNTGGLISGDALDIDASQLNNDAGYIGAQKTLEITTSGDSSNKAGIIEGLADIDIDTAAFDNDQGRVQSATTLDINTGNSTLTNTNSGNTGGLISGDTQTITAAGLNNDAGYIGAQQALEITTTGDSSNKAGVIEGLSTVEINTAAFDNDQGRIQSGTTLTIDTNGNTLTNTNSGNSGGLISGDALDIDASQLTNDAGYIGAQKALEITTTGDSANKAGIIEGLTTIDINTAAFDNDQGRVQSGTTLTIDTGDNTLTNTNSGNTGGLISGDTLDIDAAGLNNDDGYIGAQKALEITTTGDSSNKDGDIEGADSVTLNTAALDNDKGRIQSGTTLSVNTHGNTLTNTNSGATGGLVSGDTLSVTAGSVNNDAGYLGAQKQLSLTTTGNSSNKSGTMESLTAVNIDTAAFNNDQGRIQSGTTLSINTNNNTFTNTNNAAAGGVISGDTLTITASDFTNQAGYILGNSNVTITANGSNSNQQGTIETQGDLSLTSGALNNDDGLIQATGNTTVDTQGEKLTNTNTITDGGIISGAKLTVTAGSVDNELGYMGGTTDVDITARGSNSNKQGRIESQGTMSITSGELDNDQGLIRSQDNLAITTEANTNLNNTNSGDNGGIRTGGTFTLNTHKLDNTSGTITSVGNMGITTADELDNTRGDINSRGTLTTTSNALNNHQGKLQAQGDVTLNTRGHTLTNTDSGTDGGIIATGNITINAGNVTNDAGYMGSSQNIDINSTGVVSNQRSGNMISLGNITIDGTHLNNSDTTNPSDSDSQIQAAGDLTINVGTGTINNNHGLLRANGTLTANTSSIDNSNTDEDNKGIEGENVVLNSNTITNASGKIVADNLTIRGSGTINNSSGLLSASKTLDVADAASSKTQAVNNTSGTMIAGEQLKLNSFNLTGKGKVLSQGTMDVTLSGSYTHVNDFVADNNLNFTLSGGLTNQALLMANGDLNINAASIYNAANAELSGTNTTLTASGDITNYGLIDGQNTGITANRLLNYGTGRIYGDHVYIKANTLYNRKANGRSAVIAARDELDIGVGTLDNRDDSLIFSLGNASIRGTLSGTQASGRAGTITNKDATIEAMGSLEINANRLDNTSSASTYTIGTSTSTQSVTAYQRANSNAGLYQDGRWYYAVGSRFDHNGTNSRLDYRHGEQQVLLPTGLFDDYYIFRLNRTTTTNTITRNTSQMAKLISGGGMSLSIGTVNNSQSEITAGGALSSSIGTLNNSSVTGSRTVSESGTVDFYYSADYRGRHTVNGGPNNLQVHSYTTRKYIEDGEAGGYYVDVTTHGDLNGSSSTANNVSLQTSVYRSNTRATNGLTISNLGVDKVEQNASGANSADIANRTIKLGSDLSIGVSKKTLGNTGSNFRGQAGVGVNTQGGRSGANINIKTQGNANRSSVSNPALAQVSEVTGRTGVVRRSNITAHASNNSLFNQNPSPTATFLVETDPRFTNNRQWLSSTYVTNQLAQSPAITNKRIGDGFYEQRLVRQQIVELTGRRFLTGYNNDEVQYQALLDAGVTYAKQYNLRPGLSLSAAQMQNITAPLVWLEAQTVTLANGSTQKVLVPTLYAVVQDGDLLPSGALLSGDSITLNVSGSAINTGDIVSRTRVDIEAASFSDIGGRLQAAEASVNADTDALFEASDWRTTDALDITAGRDVLIRSQDQTESWDNGDGTRGSRSSVTQTSRLQVTGSDGRLNINAGRDLTVTAAEIENQGTGDTTLRAGNNLRLNTLKEGETHVSEFTTETRSNEVTSQIRGGGNVTLNAGNTLSARGADVTAGRFLALEARDIELSAAEDTIDSDHQMRNYTYQAQRLNNDGVTLNAGTDLSLRATNDITAVGANATAGSNLTIDAGGDIDIRAAQDESYRYRYYEEKKSWGRKVSELSESFNTTNVGAEFSAGNNLTINSTINDDGSVTTRDSGNVTVTGGDLSAKNNIALSGQNVTLQDQQELSFSRNERYKRGFGGASRQHTGEGTVTSTVDSTDVTAETGQLDIIAQQDITVTGSNAIGGQDTRLQAGRDVTIESSESTTTQTSFDHRSKFGLNLSGLTLSVGTRKEDVDQSTTQTSQVGSTIGSLDGNISITAERNATIAASDIIARGGDIDVEADRVDIIARDHVVDAETKHKVSFSGVSVGLSGGAADSINTIISSGERIDNTDNESLKALHSWKIANAMSDLEAQLGNLDHIGEDFKNLGRDKNVIDNDGDGTRDQTSNINLSISLGSNSSESQSNSTSRTARGSSLSAGGALNITARGDKRGNTHSGDIRAEGAYLSGNTVSLDAQDDIILQSAENTSDSSSTQKSRSAAVGLSVGADGLNVFVEGSRSDALTEQSGDQYLETRIHGNQVSITSGDDTTLEGAQVNADKITADIGGDLTIITQQDNNQFSHESESRGGRIQVGTNNSASANFSETTANANYQSVQEQSGFIAGEGGFDIEVGGNTDLTGAVIASTADPENNRLSTESLTTRNLENVSEYEVESKSASVSFGGDGARLAPPAYAEDSDKQESTTYNVISDGTIEIRDGDRSGLADVKNNQAEAVNALENNFSDDKIQEVQDQAEAVQLAAEFGSEQIGNYADAQLKESNRLREEANNTSDPEEKARLNQQADTLWDNWKEGGTLRVAAHTALGGLTGGGAGAIGSGATAAAIPALDNALKEAGASPEVRQIILLSTSAGIGAAANGTQGAIHSTGQTQNNYLNHLEATELAQLQSDLLVGEMTPEEKAAARERIAELQALDAKRDRDAVTACQSPSSAACAGVVEELTEFRQGYIDAGVVTNPRSARPSVLSESNQVNQQLQQHGHAHNNPTEANIKIGLKELGQDSIEGIANALDAVVIDSEEELINAMRAYFALAEFQESPIENTGEAISNAADAFSDHMAEIDRLSQSDDPADRDRAEQLQTILAAEVVSALSGVRALTTVGGKIITKGPEDKQQVRNDINAGTQPGNADAESGYLVYRDNVDDYQNYSLPNKQTRDWYEEQVKKIDVDVPSTRANAERISNERAELKSKARDLMSDQDARVRLDEKYPVRDFEYYENKYREQGYTGEELWKRVIQGGKTTNKKVSDSYGSG